MRFPRLKGERLFRSEAAIQRLIGFPILVVELFHSWGSFALALGALVGIWSQRNARRHFGVPLRSRDIVVGGAAGAGFVAVILTLFATAAVGLIGVSVFFVGILHGLVTAGAVNLLRGDLLTLERKPHNDSEVSP